MLLNCGVWSLARKSGRAEERPSGDEPDVVAHFVTADPRGILAACP
jgi:hypothetical protein